jgi:hypothetical protein
MEMDWRGLGMKRGWMNRIGHNDDDDDDDAAGMRGRTRQKREGWEGRSLMEKSWMTIRGRRSRPIREEAEMDWLDSRRIGDGWEGREGGDDGEGERDGKKKTRKELVCR